MSEDNLVPPGPSQQGWQTPPHPPPPPQEPQPQKGGCGGAGKWIACGCIVAFLALCAFVGGILWFVVFAIRSSDVYAGAMERAHQDPRVIEAIGEPIEPGWFPDGSLHVDNDNGSANMRIPIKGPKGKANIHAVATKARGVWTYTTLTVTTESGQTFDLLTPSEPPATTTVYSSTSAS